MTTETTSAGSSPSTPPVPLGQDRMVVMLIFGVILPALTLGIELLTHECASGIFNPIPTVFHVLLIALVPLANLAVIVALYRRQVKHLRLLGWLNGISIGISAFYALMLSPLVLWFAIMIVAFGIGLLPLSPLSALITAIVLRRRIKQMALGPESGPATRIPGLWPGMALALAILITLAVPRSITLIGWQMTATKDPALQARGLQLLRTAGNQDILLRACYWSTRDMGPLSPLFAMFGHKVTEEEARIIYYRVTGLPFYAIERPKSVGLGLTQARERAREVNGIDTIGRKNLPWLSLNESRLDTVIDADGAAAYTEWIMVFKNKSPSQQEARALVALPPGGVVSRLTLWIDGDEREAAFGGRSQVKDAYKKVVERRRDPVLVTTCGSDRVLVQCFPVPPSQGTMKIRLGITSPIDLDTLDRGLLRLPYFTDHNFILPETGVHSVWLESSGKLAAEGGANGWIAEQSPGKGFALRGTFKASMLESPLAVKVERPMAATECWAKDPRAREPGIVRQTIQEKTVLPPQRLVLVLDGSRPMNDYQTALASLVSALPQNGEFGILLASDDVKELVPLQPVSSESLSRAAELVKNTVFAYGCDNVQALSRAWDIVGGVSNSAILWLHAAQPVDLGGLEPLRQKWERRPGNPVLLCAQFVPGPDVIVLSLDKISAVNLIGRSGDMAADVRYTLALWSGEAKAIRMERKAETTAALPSGLEASFHVVRLWALDEIRRLSASNREDDHARALALAQTYQLVTPISGAVVLENQQQYQEADLKPVSSESVPSIPEPETWMLLATAAAVIMAVFYLRRRTVLARVHGS